MPKFNWVINMTPVGKERPRVTTKNNNVWAYTPWRTVKSERQIKDAVMGKGAWFKEHQGVKMVATFYRVEPDSPTVNRIRQLCARYNVVHLPVIEPDWDNYGKTLSDALNGMTFTDDCQITTAIIYKRYCKKGEQPRIEFSLEEDNGDER